MSVGRLQRIGISVALGSCVALGCGGEKSEEPAGAKSEEKAQAQPEEPAAARPDEAPAEAAAPSAVEPPTTLPDFDTLPSVELPEEFPEDVPLYPGARAVKATPDPEGTSGWVAQFSAADDPEKIYADLSNTFGALGWSTNRVDAEDGILLYANQGDRSVTYLLGTADGKTVISLIIVEEP